MRSIRLALLVYFLGLVSLALGATFFLAYRSAQQTLQAKEEATARLILAKHLTRRQEESDRVDQSLLSRAKSLAARVKVQVLPQRLGYRELHGLGAITAQAMPSAFVLMPAWYGQYFREPFGEDLYRRTIAEITLPQTDLLLPSEPATGDYFQIDSNYRGKSLGTGFPDVLNFAPNEIVSNDFDDHLMSSGQLVRRVRLKAASVTRVTTWPHPTRQPRPQALPQPEKSPPPPDRPARNGNRPGGSSPPARPRRPWWATWSPPNLAIYVQYATDRTDLDLKLLAIDAECDVELDELHSQTTTALARQRNQLLAILSTTFLATVFGAWWLVWVGLLPLRRLSEAVSQVSPRDFRLPLGDSPMPTELQPIVDRLTGTLDLLKRAFAREKQSTADISHELRTPLAAMLTTLELALRKPRTAEKYREMIADCQQSAQQMNQIVERLLALARLDAGVDRLRPQSIDVLDLARQCAAVVRPLAASQGVSVTVHPELRDQGIDGFDEASESRTQIHTDPDKLREVFTNLLHNAIQYNRPNGQIDLTIGVGSSHLQVDIRDTGIGISPEVRDRIFERFFRADPSRTSDGMNAGLGLAIVKEYVELMGGQVTVDSVVGEGSTFQVRLPVRHHEIVPAPSDSPLLMATNLSGGHVRSRV